MGSCHLGNEENGRKVSTSFWCQQNHNIHLGTKYATILYIILAKVEMAILILEKNTGPSYSVVILNWCRQTVERLPGAKTDYVSSIFEDILQT